MIYPFDDTDGPDPRPSDVVDAVAGGSSLQAAMDLVYLDEDGRSPAWGDAEIEEVKALYRERHVQSPNQYPLKNIK